MPGSWEQFQQPSQKPLVAILTRETTSTAWAFAFKNLIIPGNAFIGLSGAPFDSARNAACRTFLEHKDFSHLVFLDDDVMAPPDTLLRLMAHNLPVVSGLYYRRNEPITPVMMKDTPQGRAWITNYKIPDLVEADYVGAGILCIRRDVIEKIRAPFMWAVDREDLPPEMRMSEDYWACRRWRTELGLKILVDTSVIARHGGLSESRISKDKSGELKPTFQALSLHG